VHIGWPLEDVETVFPDDEPFELAAAMPELASGSVIVTGSGRRLREVAAAPTANLGLVTISGDRGSARLRTSRERLFARLTSEFNSHLAVHCDQVGPTKTNHARGRQASTPATLRSSLRLLLCEVASLRSTRRSASGLSAHEVRAICAALARRRRVNIDQSVF